MMRLNIQLFGGRGAYSSKGGDTLVSREERKVGGKVDLDNPKSLSRAMEALPSWFTDKEFPAGSNERYVRNLAIAGESVVKTAETEKAIRVSYDTKEGSISQWVPKSMLPKSSPEKTLVIEKYKLKKPIKIKEEIPRGQRGMKYNEYLVDYAKKKKIKGIRSMMKTDTIIKKIRTAGYEVPSRDSIDYTFTRTENYRIKTYYK